MASPQVEDGHIRIEYKIIEHLYSAPLSGSELRIAMFILRKTWGWRKKEDEISITQIQKSCVLSRKMACESLNKLVTKKLLVKTKGKINTLQFNKDYDTWIVTKRKLGSYEKVASIVTKTKPELVTKTKHTKENIKETITKEISTNVLTGFGNPDINEISSYFLGKFQIPKEDCSKGQSRQYWYHLLRESKTGVQGVKWLIDQAYRDEFYRNNITSSKDLYYKRVKIIARKRGSVPKVAIFKEAV